MASKTIADRIRETTVAETEASSSCDNDEPFKNLNENSSKAELEKAIKLVEAAEKPIILSTKLESILLTLLFEHGLVSKLNFLAKNQIITPRCRNKLVRLLQDSKDPEFFGWMLDNHSLFDEKCLLSVLVYLVDQNLNDSEWKQVLDCLLSYPMDRNLMRKEMRTLSASDARSAIAYLRNQIVDNVFHDGRLQKKGLTCLELLLESQTSVGAMRDEGMTEEIRVTAGACRDIVTLLNDFAQLDAALKSLETVAPKKSSKGSTYTTNTEIEI